MNGWMSSRGFGPVTLCCKSRTLSAGELFSPYTAEGLLLGLPPFDKLFSCYSKLSVRTCSWRKCPEQLTVRSLPVPPPMLPCASAGCFQCSCTSRFAHHTSLGVPQTLWRTFVKEKLHLLQAKMGLIDRFHFSLTERLWFVTASLSQVRDRGANVVVKMVSQKI